MNQWNIKKKIHGSQNFWSDEATYEQETYMASDNEIMVEEDIEITMDN